MLACSCKRAEKPYECTETNPHPVGESIAETFDQTYEQVMTWFCSGYTFEDILIALQTNIETDIPTEHLLEMSESMGWEEICEEVGLFEQ